ncbi:MAG: hypothetical protein NWR26_04880 [Pseudomonadales bacterium]|nr:hypothetical protein [Pseudomonadales bacterium]
MVVLQEQAAEFLIARQTEAMLWQMSPAKHHIAAILQEGFKFCLQHTADTTGVDITFRYSVVAGNRQASGGIGISPL